MAGDGSDLPSSIEDWSSGNADKSLDELYASTMVWAEKRAAWYVRKSRTQKLLSISVRFSAVVLGGVGGLVPLLLATGIFDQPVTAGALPEDPVALRAALAEAVNSARPSFEAWGYVAIALAALLVGADKLLGFSTTWMRFMQTHLRIQKAVTVFRYQWTIEIAKLAARPPDEVRYAAMLGSLKQLVETIEADVEQETKTWVDEFNRSLSQLARTYEKTAEQLRPGIISVAVTNADHADELELQIDGRTVGPISGAGRQVPNVPPGTHTVEVTGTLGGKPSADSTSVTVAAGGIAAAQLTLKAASRTAHGNGSAVKPG